MFLSYESPIFLHNLKRDDIHAESTWKRPRLTPSKMATYLPHSLVTRGPISTAKPLRKSFPKYTSYGWKSRRLARRTPWIKASKQQFLFKQDNQGAIQTSTRHVSFYSAVVSNCTLPASLSMYTSNVCCFGRSSVLKLAIFRGKLRFHYFYNPKLWISTS